ncbi:MAG: hypothetical protein U0745_04500 [Polyangia bacterium]
MDRGQRWQRQLESRDQLIGIFALAIDVDADHDDASACELFVQLL